MEVVPSVPLQTSRQASDILADSLALMNERVDDDTNEIEFLSTDKKDSVLIIEDNVDLRNYIRLILEKEFMVFVAADGEEGV